jgi:hypothetical protein
MKVVSAKIVIMSHLSDASMEISFKPEQAQKRIEFAKFLILKYPNTKEDIDPDEEWELFENRNK